MIKELNIKNNKIMFKKKKLVKFVESIQQFENLRDFNLDNNQLVSPELLPDSSSEDESPNSSFMLRR